MSLPERVIELLEDLSRYPVATTYPDGPCIEWQDMEELKAILAEHEEGKGKNK